MKTTNQLKINLFLSILLLVVVDSYGLVCEVRNTCECVLQDGSGTGYDLSSVLGTSDYLEAVPNSEIHILFSPCKNSNKFPWTVNETLNECRNGYTLCLYEVSGSAHLLGSTANTSFDIQNDEVLMKFGTTKVSTVELQCAPNAKNSILYAPQNTTASDVKLTLFSAAACIKQIDDIVTHGFFYTFFLVAFIVLFSYLVVGILYNYFFVGARGFELVPNYDFWTRLWSSVKLGFLFVKNGFRVIPTEDSYDAI